MQKRFTNSRLSYNQGFQSSTNKSGVKKFNLADDCSFEEEMGDQVLSIDGGGIVRAHDESIMDDDQALCSNSSPSMSAKKREDARSKRLSVHSGNSRKPLQTSSMVKSASYYCKKTLADRVDRKTNSSGDQQIAAHRASQVSKTSSTGAVAPNDLKSIKTKAQLHNRLGASYADKSTLSTFLSKIGGALS